MKFNVFSGARRIALLIGGITASVFVYMIITEPVTVVAIVEDNPKRFVFPGWEDNYPPTKEKGIREPIIVNTDKGTKANVYIRFKTEFDETGKEHFLDIYGKRIELGNVRYVELMNFLEFKDIMPYHHYLDKQWKWRKLQQIRMFAEILVRALGGLLIFTYAMGWIVRGFLGIPMGQDFRPEPQKPQESNG